MSLTTIQKSKPERFKDSEVGKIPEDWEVVRLGDVGTLQYGFTASAKNDDTGIKFLRITDITDNGIDWSNVPCCEVNESELKKYELNAGDVLFARIGSTTGKTCHIDRYLKGVFASYLIRFRPFAEDIDTKFLYFYTQSRFYWLQINKNKDAHLKKGINAKVLGNLLISLPPLPEQRAIASILGTVDSAIQKVNEAIAGTERLKKGLMQRLLTKGIGHNGRFKDSEIGKIPEDWDIARLGDEHIADLIMGQSPPSSTYNDKEAGLPFLQGNADFGETYPAPMLSCSQPTKIAEKNDVLLSVRAPVGDVNINPSKSCIGRGLAAIRPKSDKLNYIFLYHYLKFASRKFESLSMGSTFKAIRKTEVENFQIPLPPLPEQRAIASILGDVDQKLELQRARKGKLERLKAGLMADLLTGRKRVKVK